MRRIGQLLLFAAIGLGLAWALSVDVSLLSHSAAYKYGAYTLLAIGLYAATAGIDLDEARRDRRIIVPAVTVGVIVKALLIGGGLALAWQDPLFLVLGVVVAQIDPLSVATLMGDKRMSVRARTVLAAWSSFDDPFTVVLSIYAAAVAINTFGVGGARPSGTDPLLLYAIDLGGNLLMALVAWVLWRLVGRREWLRWTLLLIFFGVGVGAGYMLAIAIIGLFARPATVIPYIPRVTQWALSAASIGLGILLIDGVDPLKGASLGAAAFLAQAIVAVLLTRGMPKHDQRHLAAAQQNGITAIILALTLEIQFNGIVAVVAPAILTANLLHVVVNHLIDRGIGHGATTATPRQAHP